MVCLSPVFALARFAERKLSKFMDKENMSRYKALLLEIKYAIDTKYYCYQIKSEVNLNGP